MGSIVENRYRYSMDSIDTSIDTQIFFQKSPSRTLHPQISHVFRLSDIKFFTFLKHLPRFLVISILDSFYFIFFRIFSHYSNENTKYRYLNKVTIVNDTKRYRYSITNIDTISHH